MLYTKNHNSTIEILNFLFAIIKNKVEKLFKLQAK